MLTAAQVKTVAYTDDHCEFYCEHCAGEKWGALFVARLEAGLEESPVRVHTMDGGWSDLMPSVPDPTGVEKVSDYNMGEVESREVESRVESLAQEEGKRAAWHGREIDPETEIDAFEIMERLQEQPVIQCAGHCGRWYTGGAEPWQEWDGSDENKPAYVRSADDARWLW